ncbi:polyketide synthase of type I domain protein [Burkholderia pseudomallei TSV5]|nr:putative mixed type I polyketide synthase/nonribosomal peptide synthetase [Burkholderia pseudomallei]KGR94794.1 putative mixed type I polyketide synthase/nonribosomal peptide synthetase [Burkholderia pseudomallei MSHR5608]KGS16769.1 putative mixed type I polyketide synthase/nonribosomal peptide synthetase [Burkholderia pseudomallei MSHR4378]KGS71603.1 putative mixed type I polyketide synthase/nonribosomal peptide synthetase [Burkholderia pseudomallei MSHR4868]KGX46967.1 putative mixed type I
MSASGSTVAAPTSAQRLSRCSSDFAATESDTSPDEQFEWMKRLGPVRPSSYEMRVGIVPPCASSHA